MFKECVMRQTSNFSTFSIHFIGHIMIGVATLDFSLVHLPGWKSKSIGYDVKDGKYVCKVPYDLLNRESSAKIFNTTK